MSLSQGFSGRGQPDGSPPQEIGDKGVTSASPDWQARRDPDPPVDDCKSTEVPQVKPGADDKVAEHSPSSSPPSPMRDSQGAVVGDNALSASWLEDLNRFLAQCSHKPGDVTSVVQDGDGKGVSGPPSPSPPPVVEGRWVSDPAEVEDTSGESDSEVESTPGPRLTRDSDESEMDNKHTDRREDHPTPNERPFRFPGAERRTCPSRRVARGSPAAAVAAEAPDRFQDLRRRQSLSRGSDEDEMSVEIAVDAPENRGPSFSCEQQQRGIWLDDYPVEAYRVSMNVYPGGNPFKVAAGEYDVSQTVRSSVTLKDEQVQLSHDKVIPLRGFWPWFLWYIDVFTCFILGWPTPPPFVREKARPDRHGVSAEMVAFYQTKLVSNPAPNMRQLGALINMGMAKLREDWAADIVHLLGEDGAQRHVRRGPSVVWMRGVVMKALAYAMGAEGIKERAAWVLNVTDAAPEMRALQHVMETTFTDDGHSWFVAAKRSLAVLALACVLGLTIEWVSRAFVWVRA